MRAVLFSLLLITLAAIVACKGEPTKEVASAPAAGTSASPQPVKSVAKIVAFGDSLTAGYGLGPEVVILELGANDILRGQPITEMKKNLSAIIERAKARGAKVLLAGMEAPTNSGIDYRRWTHGAFADLAKEHNVPMIPFLLDRVAGIQSLNQADGIHPNAQGARIVADTVYQYLKPMLEKQ
jgi:acyl-CoA thioesterase-1